MNRAVIRRAAATARILGYRAVNSRTTLDIVSPTGSCVFHYFFFDKPLDISQESALGHFLTRLHMEKHYGIHTEHYWEH